MLLKVRIAQILLLSSALNNAFGLDIIYGHKPSQKYLEFEKRISHEQRVFRDCLNEKGLNLCDKGQCLSSSKINKSLEYYNLLSEYQDLCKEKSVIDNLTRTKEYWKTIEFDSLEWDIEGPSINAIEKWKYSPFRLKEINVQTKKELTKKKNKEFEDFFKKLSVSMREMHINIKDFRVRKEFYTFFKTHPSDDRNFKSCLDQPLFDKCEKLVCLTLTKLNKNFHYYKLTTGITCDNPEIFKAYFMKLNQWLYDDGSHPTDWDSEGMPDHVLKTKKELEIAK